MKFIVLVVLSFIFCTPCNSKSITPQQFSNIWETGNKFRLMRHQSSIINPKNRHYKPTGFGVSYFETTSSFDIKEKQGPLEANIASIKADFYSKYAFFDLGAMDVRESIFSDSQELNDSKYTRIISGVRYNELGFAGITAGILITETPLNEDESFVFGEQESAQDAFISLSFFGFQLMANTLNAENLIVETSSYDLNFDDVSMSLMRSKIHDNGKQSRNKTYDDEYVLDIFVNSHCEAAFSNVKSYCGYGFKRRETYNDQSQGWTAYITRPFYSIRLNSFDENTDLRQHKYGYALKLGIDALSSNVKNKSSISKDYRVKFSFGIHMNDGTNQLFEVQDELMAGFELDILVL